MKHFLVFGLIFCIIGTGHARKQGNIWYFGKGVGLDFSSGTPVQITGGKTGSGNNQEGTAVISDSAGNLLFYSDGALLYNRNHQQMAGSFGLMGSISSTQSSIILPKPGSDSHFYVFTSDAQENYPGNPSGYNYSVVDLCLDNGLGDVIKTLKNVHLADSGTEKLCAGDDGKGGYWIVGHKLFNDEFHAWHLTDSGITDRVISRVGMVHGSTGLINASLGQMKFNPACTKLAMGIQSAPDAAMEVFDFDPNTGVLSNPCRKVLDNSGRLVSAYGIEFSPDGTKLYVATTSTADTLRAILQFDVTSGSCGSILSSMDTIFKSKAYLKWTFGMQLGPDGKIYVANVNPNLIGRINYPDLTGSAVSYDSAFMTLPGLNVISLRAFTDFVAGYRYHSGLTGPCSVIPNKVSNHVKSEAVSLFPNPVNGKAVLTISSSMDLSGIQLVVKDAVGRTMQIIAVSQRQTSLDFSELVSGLYFYQVRQHDQVIRTDRFLVK